MSSTKNPAAVELGRELRAQLADEREACARELESIVQIRGGEPTGTEDADGWRLLLPAEIGILHDAAAKLRALITEEPPSRRGK